MMSTISAAAGVTTPVSTALPGSLPQPAAASGLPGASLAGTLPPMAIPSFQPQGEIAASPAETPTEEATADSDPQQLLDLLLAAPVAQPAEVAAAAPARHAGPVSAGGGSAIAALNPQADSAGLLRNTLLAAGSPPTGLSHPAAAVLAQVSPATPLTAARHGFTATQSSAVPITPSATEPAEIALHNAPKKLVTPADALLASKSVQQMLRAEREPLAAETTLLHPAPALMNALLKGEVVSGKLPTITLPAAPEQQAEALQKALAERLEMQIDRRVQKATIRLDPPNLGKMDISIHYESGKLQVQIQAAQPEVTRLLQQVSHEMRASLSEQNSVQVNVQVSTQSGDSRQQQRHRDRPETAIANNNEEVTPQQRGTDGTILTMV